MTTSGCGCTGSNPDNLSDLTTTLQSLVMPTVYVLGGFLLARKTKLLKKQIKSK